MQEPAAPPGPFLRTPLTQTVYFWHIPKAGGTTLASILQDFYDPTEVCPVHLLEPLVLETAPGDRLNYRLYWGHFADAPLKFLPTPPFMIALLRDPIRTLLSYYRFIQRTPEHPYHELVQGMSLAGFLATRETASATWNSQTQMLGLDVRLDGRTSAEIWNRPNWPFHGADETALLERALANLERCAIVGICERMNDTLRLVCQALEVTTSRVGEMWNVDPAPLSWEALSQDDQAAVLRATRLDAVVYHEAKARFEASLRKFPLQSLIQHAA
jgi:hypothetical protein